MNGNIAFHGFGENSDYTLVQDSFSYLDVKSLEDKCEEENVLPKINSPTVMEEKYLNVLIECTKELFIGFLQLENLPSCDVIKYGGFCIGICIFGKQ